MTEELLLDQTWQPGPADFFEDVKDLLVPGLHLISPPLHFVSLEVDFVVDSGEEVAVRCAFLNGPPEHLQLR